MYYLKINKERFESSKSKLTGQEILEIAHLTPVEDFELLYKINEKGFTPIQIDEEVDLTSPGIEGFNVRPYKKLSITVDNILYEVEECFLTPYEIMNLAGIDPDYKFLSEIRKGGIEVSYKDDVEHKISITKSSSFTSYVREEIESIIVNAREKTWINESITFDDVVRFAYGEVSNNPNVIYTVIYKNGVPSKPEASMVKGETISVKNKMIFNVTQTNKS